MRRLIRPVFNKLASMVGIPGIQSRLDEVESRVAPQAVFLALMERRITDLTMSQLVPVRDEVSLLSAHIENRLHSLNEALVAYVDAKQEQNSDSIDAFVQQQKVVISEIRQSVDTIRRLAHSEPAQRNRQDSDLASSKQHDKSFVIDDALYVALENHFRGSRDVVAQRQSDYLPMLPQVLAIDAPLIDLGCGRGEWLKVLRERGIPAFGVDSNSVCISECREEGLEVVESDLINFLAERPNASVGAFTLFQVLEHLSFPALVDTLREIKRTLVPGGRLIAEVPNAKNLRVSAGTFWIDPTHQKPLFPDLLIFLATEVGFTAAEGHYTNKLAPDYDLSGLPDGATRALSNILEAVDGPGDFALIATA